MMSGFILIFFFSSMVFFLWKIHSCLIEIYDLLSINLGNSFFDDDDLGYSILETPDSF